MPTQGLDKQELKVAVGIFVWGLKNSYEPKVANYTLRGDLLPAKIAYSSVNMPLPTPTVQVFLSVW